MTTKAQSAWEEAVGALRRELGDNLYSCCLYGSAVRGNAIEGVSDLNLLIVLQESNCAAHSVVARALAGSGQVDPFILGRRGFERSVRAFAVKFASIRRNYRLLHGADPLDGIEVDQQIERFLCEQGLRNLRLRLAYSFVTRQQNKAYGRFLTHNVTPLFVQLSEALRLSGCTIPKEFAARIPIFEKEFKIDGAVLRDLLALKQAPKQLSDAAQVAWHERVFPMVDAVMAWVETKWPA
jgi:hypothetical protein